MKEKPLCTIILPTIGRPKYFGAALASVAAQTYRPFNILVSDNAANPPIELAEIQKWAPEAIVRLVRRPARIEPTDHINLCVKEADGEYVFFMSDDDLIVPGYIAASMECILSEPSVNAVIAQKTRIEESFFGPISNAPIHFKTLPGNKFMARWLIEGNLNDILTTFPMLVRRRQMLECGGLPEYPDGSYSSNTVLFELCLGAKVGLLEGGYYYRVYPTSEGLQTPWRWLFAATQNYDRDLLALHKKGRLGGKLFLAIVRGNTGLLISRWKQLYRRRAGFANKVRPVLDIAFRIFNLGWHYGLGAVPKLHKYFDSDSE
jgi:glycosyltransferase involved in cell wall biosynthesis